MSLQYSVEFNVVRYNKYRSGAPKHLLKLGGRWQRAGLYGGFDNIDYVPSILTDNKAMYEAAPAMYKALEVLSKSAVFRDNHNAMHIDELLKTARGE